MSDQTLMTDAATTTEGAPASSTAAPAADPATAGSGANAAQQQQAPAASASPDGSQPAGDQSKGDQDANSAQQQGAPEKYEFAPIEGVTLDDTTMQAYSEVARELNMPQEAAQKILDKVAPIMAQRQAEVLNTLNTQWVDTVRGDKEIGGDKLQENLAVAKKAMEAFGTPELRELLNESRLGNHPEVIRFMLRAGKAISEDRYVPGGNSGSPGASRDAAKSLYPNQ